VAPKLAANLVRVGSCRFTVQARVAPRVPTRLRFGAMTSRSESASSADAAALLLRLTVGPMLMVHGYNKVFGKGGLDGTTRWFDGLGLKPAHIHARMAAATELGAGAAITVGAASPLPSAAAIGLMVTAARTDHRGKGFFMFRNGWEYVGVVGAVSAIMALLGPGRFSLDGLIGRPRHGVRAALFAAILGVVSALGLLASSYHPEPAADPEGESDG
jgi:putative oxidoreductase